MWTHICLIAFDMESQWYDLRDQTIPDIEMGHFVL